MDLSRYSCQIALPGFGLPAQQLLQQAKVLIVGLGGLGCPAALYLASCGIGLLGLADYDIVSVSNLHRQILYTPAEVGQPKVQVAAKKLQDQNPAINIVTHFEKIDAQNVITLFEQYDLVIDGTDNFEARYLLNDAAVITGRPLVYGAIYQYEGQVSVWNVLNEDGTRSPNYRDIYPKVDPTQIPNCAEGGVLPMLAGIIGCIQASEAVKYITKTGDVLAGKIMLLDTQSMQSRVIKIGHATDTKIENLPENLKPKTITASELQHQLELSDIDLIDIRSDQEHEEFNIGGRHIPAYKLERFLSGMDTSKLVVLYCAIGKRSADAVKKLSGLAPQLNVVSLEGGVNGWIKHVKA